MISQGCLSIGKCSGIPWRCFGREGFIKFIFHQFEQYITGRACERMEIIDRVVRAVSIPAQAAGQLIRRSGEIRRL